MSVVIKAKLTASDYIKWAFTLGIPACIMLIPVNDLFTANMRLFFAITLMAILTFAFENVNQTTVALLLPLSYVFFNVAPSSVVFQPWTQYVPWMTLSGLLMANVLESTGLLKRVAYFCILKTGATYSGILWGLAIAGLLLTLFVGSVVIPMAALTYGVCLALNTGKSKESAGIMLVGAMSALLPNMMKFTGPVLMVGIGAPVTGELKLLGFFESLIVNAPTLLFLCTMVFIATKMFKPDTPLSGKEFFSAKLKESGKMSLDEWKTAAVIILYFVFIVTEKYHGMSITWGMAFVPLLMALPVVGAATADDIRRLNYGFILFVAACMGIGSVAGSLGIGAILVQIVMPILEGQSYYLFFLIEWVLLVVCNFVMTPLAMEAAFTVPLATIGTSLGLNPMAIYFFMMNGVDQIIMPYQYALYMIFFAFGLIRLNDFMKLMAIKMVVNFIFCFAGLLTWWKIIGFLFV